MRHSGPVETCAGPECLIDLLHVCVHPRQLYSSIDVKIFRLPKLKTKHNNLSLFKALVYGTNSLTTSDIFFISSTFKSLLKSHPLRTNSNTLLHNHAAKYISQIFMQVCVGETEKQRLREIKRINLKKTERENKSSFEHIYILMTCVLNISTLHSLKDRCIYIYITCTILA